MYVPPGFATVNPYIFASDAKSYVQFLVDGLGAEELGRSERPDGRIANCQIRIGTATKALKAIDPVSTWPLVQARISRLLVKLN